MPHLFEIGLDTEESRIVEEKQKALKRTKKSINESKKRIKMKAEERKEELIKNKNEEFIKKVLPYALVFIEDFVKQKFKILNSEYKEKQNLYKQLETEKKALWKKRADELGIEYKN